MTIPEITPIELAAELEGENPPVVIDVREVHELEISSLPGAVHIPLGELVERLPTLDKEANIVVLCRVGGRSGQAVAYMRQVGFARVRNLATGINGWARTVDPSMPQY
jgi:rhodanese-related sulfurtransferase